MQFEVIVVTDPPTHPPTNTACPLQTDRQDRLQYTVPQLARSVNRNSKLLRSPGIGETKI